MDASWDTPREQRNKRPRPVNLTLGSFLTRKMANSAVTQSISKEVLVKQLESKFKRPDGGAARKRPFGELSDAEKFANIDSRLNGLRKDINQNSFRMYGVQNVPQKVFSQEELSAGNPPRKMFIHEVLEEVFVKALNIDPSIAKTMTTSGLADIYRFRESGSNRQYCVVFKLNRSDLCGHVFKNLSRLGNFHNPYGTRPLTISRNLSEEENKERQKCLAIKDVLKSRGFDPKIKKNIFISVNGAEPKHYSMFLEGEEGPLGSKKRRLENAEDGEQRSVVASNSNFEVREESSEQSSSQGAKNKSVLSKDYPPLPRTDDLTPEQRNKVMAYIEKVQSETSTQ